MEYLRNTLGYYFSSSKKTESVIQDMKDCNIDKVYNIEKNNIKFNKENFDNLILNCITSNLFYNKNINTTNDENDDKCDDNCECNN
jgi:hypothetical protein